MSRKNKHRQRGIMPGPHPGSPAINTSVATTISTPTLTPQVPTLQEATERLKQEHAEAVKHFPAEDLPPVSAPPSTPGPDASEIYQIAEQTRLARERLDLKRQECEQRLQDFHKRESELRNQKSEQDGRQQQLVQKESELIRKEADLARRELEARSGFASELRKELEKLCGEASRLEQHLSQIRSEVASERAEWDMQREAERRKLQEERIQFRDEKERELEAERRELQTLRKQLVTERNLLVIENETFAEEQKLLDKRVEQRSARRVEEMTAVAATYKEERDQAREDRQLLQERLRQFDDWLRRFGEKSPREILDQLHALQENNMRLQEQLAERPGQDQLERLRALEAEREQKEQENLLLRRETNELRYQIGRFRAHSIEEGALRDQNEALEASNKLFKTALEGLKKQIDELTRQAGDQNYFPACKGMDEKDRNEPTSLWDRVEDLKAFAEELRQRIGWDSLTGKELYYEARDLRAFLGGLAMSKLHILQGISGTGKTSLPLAFARATGAGHTLVEVQAGWRDKNDLLGHLNSFEQRFHETDFLQGLYQAQCPAYRDKLYLIVLDEMNLSRPEQYFADFLSALEQDEKKQLITLLSTAAPAPPLGFHEGRKLRVPPNVWFIGTANHDETTVEFADKTYDRAHVMELPHEYEPFPLNKNLRARHPLALAALQDAFTRAQKTHADKASQAYQFIKLHLRDLLFRHFRIGWSNRLRRQVDAFVPVVLAAGGTLGEGIDYLVSTKVLRKLRDRHDLRADMLLDIRKALRVGWKQLSETAGPQRCEDLLNHELHKLGEHTAAEG